MQFLSVPVLLMLGVAMSEMATDIYAPSLPHLARYFMVNEEIIQLTLSINLYGFAVSSLFYGPLSDAYGRRTVTLIGFGVFLIASFFCIIVPSIELFIILRFLQGVGAGVTSVLSIAIIRDMYKEEESARIMSMMGVVIALIPAMAPILGGYLTEFYGWQLNFIVIVFVSIFVFLAFILSLPETLAARHRKPLMIKTVMKVYKNLITDYVIMVHVLIAALMIAGIWVYIAVSPFAFHYIGVSTVGYGLYAIIAVLGYIGGSLLNRSWIERHGFHRCIYLGLWTAFAGGIAMLATAYWTPENPVLLSISIGIYAAGAALVFPNAATQATEVSRATRGSASSMVIFVEMLLGGVAISCVGSSQNTSLVPTGIAMLILALLSIGLYASVSHKDT